MIAEDSVILREGLARILRDEGFEMSTVASPEQLLASINREPHDVAIIDVRMPPTYTDEGIRAAIEIRDQGHSTPLLLFSQYIETTGAIKLLRRSTAGFGYLLKDRVLDVDEFLDALRRVAKGGSAIDPVIISALLGPGHSEGVLASLSSREIDVLKLMAEGLTNSAIATRLHLSRRTVETHVNGVFTKLRLAPTQDDHRRVQAVVTYLGRRTG